MEALILAALCLLSATKVTVQSKFAKNNVKTSYDSIVFNGIIFTMISVLFAAFLFRGFELSTFLFGAAFGILSVCFQLFYTRALATGPVSLTVLIINLSVIIAVAFSVIVYGDKFTVFKIIGMVLTIISFFLNAKIDKSKKAERSWLLLVIATFISNVLLQIDQKVFSRTINNGQSAQFVSFTYIVAAVVCAVIFLIKLPKGEKTTFSFKGPVWIYTAIIAVVLGSYQVLNTYGVGVINGVVFYPVTNGGVTLLMTLSGVLIFHEKLSARQWIGVVTGIIAIVFMSL